MRLFGLLLVGLAALLAACSPLDPSTGDDDDTAPVDDDDATGDDDDATGDDDDATGDDDDATGDDDDSTFGNPEPPGEVVISLAPTSPVTTDDLEWFVIEDAVDPNGEVVTYATRWLHNGAPRADLDDQTVVPASETARDDVWDLRVTPVDPGGLEGPTATASVTVQNSPPTATLSIGPLSPGTTDDLVLTISTDDADGDAVTTDIVWLIDTNPSAAHAGFQTIPAADTTTGQVWEVQVTPSDPSGPGAVVTQSASIGNTPPTVAYATIGPADPVEGQSVSVSAAPDLDIDGDIVTLSYAWLVDGVVVTGETGTSLDSAFFDKGEEIVCEVTADDGTSSTSLLSNSVFAANTPPTITGVDVDPQVGFETTVFTCLPSGWTDPDPADPPSYTYAWTVNGAASITTATIDGADFDKGDDLGCTATPYDSDVTGAPITATAVTVSNSPPVVTSVSIGPASPTEGDTVTATPAGWSDDDGDTEGYQYAWYVGGSLASTSPTIDGSVFDDGQDIVLELTPWDGEDSGAFVTSNTLQAVNTPPSITGVILDPNPAFTDTALTAIPQGWVDPDPSDPPTYDYVWTVGGQPAGSNSATLASSAFVRGDVIAVEVTPTDGQSTGAPVTDTLTIANTPPSFTMWLDPAQPAEGDTITVYTQVDPDPDGDTPTWSYSWVVAGNAVLGQTSDTLTSDYWDKDQLVEVFVAADDGFDVTTETDSVTPVNTLPTITGVDVTPTFGTAADVFTCTPLGWYDPDPADSPTYSYSWEQDRFNWITVIATTATVDLNDFEAPSALSCAVTPTNPEGPGTAVSSAWAPVYNTPPSFTGVTLTNMSPNENTNTQAVVAGYFDIDGHSQGGTLYEWINVATGTVQYSSYSYFLNPANYEKGDQLYVLAYPQDVYYGVGTPVQSATFTVGNVVPSMTGVTISPSSPTSSENVTAIPAGWSDPDSADAPGYDYQWYVDGSPVGTNSDTLQSAWFARGQDITVTAWPNDGTDVGSPVFSAISTVQNSLPSITAVSVDPPSPVEGDTVTAVPVGWFDADGDQPDFDYLWFVDSTYVGANTTLTGADFDKGQSIHVWLTPKDTYGTGTYEASPLVYAVNTPPSVTSVTIDNQAPYTDDNLLAVATGWSDPDPADSEDYVYAWFLDGNPVGTDDVQLLASETAKNLPVTVTITADDGTALGNSVTSTGVTVLNTPPAAPVVDILPEDPDETVDLVCTAVTQTADLDGDTITYDYTWWLDGIEETAYTTDTVPAADTALAETWMCAMTPDDGQELGNDGDATVRLSECGWAAHFNSAGDQINMNINDSIGIPGSGNFTWEVWMKRVGGTEGCLLCNPGPYSNNYVRTDYFKYKFDIWNGSFRWLYYSVPQGVWSHLVIQRSGNDIRAFVDGVVADTNTVGTIYRDGGGGWRFDPNNSIIDQVRRSNAAVYPTGGFTPSWPLTVDNDTVALWDFNEGQGTQVRNEATDGWYTISGAVLWTTEQADACP